MADDDDIRAKLDALKEAYRNNLKERMDILEDAYASLTNSSGEAEGLGNLKPLIEISHKIAGSAGTFGFDKLSAAASELEEYCEEIAKGDSGIGDRERQELEKMVAACRDSAAQ